MVQTAFVCILDVGLREGLLGTGRGAAFALGVVLLLLVSGLAGVGLGFVVLLDLLLLSVGELVLLDGDFRGHGVSGGWCLLRVSA